MRMSLKVSCGLILGQQEQLNALALSSQILYV